MIRLDQVAAWVRDGASESERLDFKAAFWTEKQGRSRGEEIAKDVAALLNHRGGTLLVGVSETAERATGFAPPRLPDRAEQVVRQTLENHLEPRAAASLAECYVLAGDAEGEQRQVLVVEVRGWPHGAVAVRQEGGGYRLPVRRGTHTVDMAWEDAMRDVATAHRRTWLRLGGWKESHSRLPVFVGSGIGIVGPGGKLHVLPGAFEEHFAELGDLAADSVQLRIVRTAYARWLSTSDAALAEVTAAADGDFAKLVLTSLRSGAAQQAWRDTHLVSTIAVPFELIRACWLDGDAAGARLHLVLDADLVFGGSRWHLRPSRSGS